MPAFTTATDAEALSSHQISLVITRPFVLIKNQNQREPNPTPAFLDIINRQVTLQRTVALNHLEAQ